MSPAEEPTVFMDGGPRDGETDTSDVLAPVIGSGNEGGVYQRTEERRDGLVVYRWQPLTEPEAEAIVRGDLRANQKLER